MKNFLLLGAVIIILFAGIIGFKKQSVLTPTNSSQEQVIPTAVVTRLATQVQGQVKTVPLTISEPSNNLVTSTSSVTVKGITVGNADVSVNEKDLKSDAQGNFSTTISLDEGENIIAVLAVDQAGNFVEQDLTVTLNSGAQ